MPHCFGYRARTRHLFSKGFRNHGPVHLSKIMQTYRKGDFVDVIADGSIHKGMPHKFYHGKTGRVFDVTQHAVGVVINKQHRGRIIPKRIHVRIEHVRRSECREAFKRRVRENDAKKREAKAQGKKIFTKRIPAQPKDQHVVEGAKTTVEFMNPFKHRDLF
jgi:large subunit ribosomal protein L21e